MGVYTIPGASVFAPTTAGGAPRGANMGEAQIWAVEVEKAINTAISGIRWALSVDLATTANITLSGEQTIDGTLTSASRVLVKNQSSAAANGIYVTAAGAWTRATDANTADELIRIGVGVKAGTANAGKLFVCTNTSITLGTTALTFVDLGPAIDIAVAAADITDSTTVGRAILTAANAAAAMTAQGITANGQSLITAANYAAMKTLLGLDEINTGEIADGAVTLAKMQNLVSGYMLGRYSETNGQPEQVLVGGGLEFSAGNLRLKAMTGDVTKSAGDGATAIAAGSVTNSKQANMVEGTVKTRRAGAGTGAPTDTTLANLKTDLALVKGDVGLGNVDNTSDVNKPVSTAQQAALDDKIDISGRMRRPGDAPISYATTLPSGDPLDIAPLTPADTQTDDDGAVVRLTGPGIVAERSLTALEPARLYQSRFVVRRRVNTGDPANDAVRVAIAWYDQNKIKLAGGSAQTVIQDINDLTVASGRRQVIETFSRSSGVGADNVAPSTARYARAYVQTYGSTTAATDIEIIDTIDTTDLTAWSPDVSVFDGRLVALEGLDAGARLDALETSVGTPSKLTFATQADAVAATIPGYVDEIELLNYATVGDGLGKRYVRAASEPAHSNKFQSADGAWWERHWIQVDVSGYAAQSIVDDSGDEIPSGTTAKRWKIAAGTFADPVTTKGPLLRIDKYENISSAEQANPADNGNNAALAIFTQGSAASEVQTAGIWSYARGAGTTVGKTADVCAMLGIGEAIRDSTRVAFGGYFEGKKNFTANRAGGAEIRASNFSGADDAYTPGALTSAGLWITAGGDGDSGAGIALGRVTAGIDFKVGVGVYAAANQAFRDDSDAGTSILINGSHDRGIDLSGGTFSGSAILLPNVGKLRSKNAAGTETRELIHLSTGDQLIVGPAATNTIRMNTGATAALGFFGAATVAKPTVSGSRANPEAALADLLAELATLGLITNSTTA